ncbi:MAG: DAK2 domain-containing protein, partial [Solirubrobacteraceae bacterium]
TIRPPAVSSADPSIVRFRQAVGGALAYFESRRQEINDLNVFPVADGDTGDNMALTLQSVLDVLDAVVAEGVSLDEIGRDALVKRLARAALLGARGNSGVILSQLIRGAAEELIARPGELIRPPLIAAALAGAARRGYDSVRQPVEGTILTVVREMAGAASHAVATMDPDQLGTPHDAEAQARGIVIVIAAAIAAGQVALDEGPELLQALKDAGVVDAGGFGLLIVFAGLIRTLADGGPGADFAIRHYDAARVEQLEHASETYRYCTNFAVAGTRLDAGRARDDLATLGDSIIVVVGDEQTLKVHVHTDDPDAAMALFPGAEISRVDVADMNEQVADRRRRGEASEAAEAAVTGPAGVTGTDATAGAASALLAVTPSAGIAGIFRSFGAAVLDGGPTMNPSTADLLAAVEATGADGVVLLPNNPNVRMAAERAAELSSRPVRVVPTRAPQAGMTIAVAHEPTQSVEENAAALTALLADVSTGGVAPAARDDAQGRFVAGDAVGYVDEELVAWGEPAPTLRAVLDRLADDRELLTIVVGRDAPLVDADVHDAAPGHVDVELHEGGQPSWWWLAAAE